MKKNADLTTIVIYKPVADGRAYHRAALEAVADGIVEWILSGAGVSSTRQEETLGDQLLLLEPNRRQGAC